MRKEESALNTKRIKIESLARDGANVARAAAILRAGGVVAIPTETVYGLAANAFDSDAVAKIFRAKGRPQDNPLIAHIADFEMLAELAREVPEDAVRLARAFWPGPLTMVLPKTDRVPDAVTAGLDTVAVRMPNHPVARALIAAADVPLAAPSANTSGRPSPTTARHVLDDLDGKIDAVVLGGASAVGVESTVILLAEGKKRLLRPGGVTREQLESVIGPVELDSAVLSAELTERASAPGMKYKHYAPRTRVVLVEGGAREYGAFLRAHASERAAALCFAQDDTAGLPRVEYGDASDASTQAHGLFDALRRADALDAEVIYAHAPHKDGVGLAVYNRLLRAAAFDVVAAGKSE